MDNIIKNIQNINEKVSIYLITILIIFILLIFCIYWLIYIRNLQFNSCNLLNNTYSKLNNNIRSLQSSDPQCGYTLKDYYIKTAYNCCNVGNYTNSFVNTCILKDILKQGVRALDFEIFSIDDTPVVSSSIDNNYHIKQTYNYIFFKDIMNILNYNAPKFLCNNFSNFISKKPRRSWCLTTTL
jgi:hypothetical protein